MSDDDLYAKGTGKATQEKKRLFISRQALAGSHPEWSVAADLDVVIDFAKAEGYRLGVQHSAKRLAKFVNELDPDASVFIPK